ncbi:hypothetical protein G9A89_006788 [Geosiphon pyriformis]|nr:hypothetical protein G9A89_006788 [Geosiphon pyriformis]
MNFEHTIFSLQSELALIQTISNSSMHDDLPVDSVLFLADNDSNNEGLSNEKQDESFSANILSDSLKASSTVGYVNN